MELYFVGQRFINYYLESLLLLLLQWEVEQALIIELPVIFHWPEMRLMLISVILSSKLAIGKQVDIDEIL